MEMKRKILEGIVEMPIDDARFKLAQLNVADSGLGLFDSDLTSHAAYVASFAEFMFEFVQDFRFFDQEDNLQCIENFFTSLDVLRKYDASITVGSLHARIMDDRNKKTMKLRCAVKDGIVVEHTITASKDDVTFAITAHNPTAQESGAHWAQPCIRLGDFTGYDNKGKDLDDYLPKGFIFLDGKLARMSDIKPWAKEARYIPGQVWCPKDVPRTDVNPRPLSPLVPSNGLIGCFSGDEKMIFSVAFEPYQELFQGVARCVHSDFRIGGLKPGETKKIRGKIYITPNDVAALLSRYAKDFPEHQGK